MPRRAPDAPGSPRRRSRLRAKRRSAVGQGFGQDGPDVGRWADAACLNGGRSTPARASTMGARAPCAPPPLGRRRPRRDRRRVRDARARRPVPRGVAPGRPRRTCRRSRPTPRTRTTPTPRRRATSRPPPAPVHHHGTEPGLVDRAYAPRVAVPGIAPAGHHVDPVAAPRRRPSAPARPCTSPAGPPGAPPRPRSPRSPALGRGRLARRPAQPARRRARRGDGRAGQRPVAAPGLEDLGGARPATTRTAPATSATTCSRPTSPGPCGHAASCSR